MNRGRTSLGVLPFFVAMHIKKVQWTFLNGMTKYRDLLPGILAGCHIFVSLKCFDEITQIIKTAGIGYLSHTFVCGRQQKGCMLDALVVQVVHGRAMRHLLKEPAEIFGRHTR